MWHSSGAWRAKEQTAAMECQAGWMGLGRTGQGHSLKARLVIKPTSLSYNSTIFVIRRVVSFYMGKDSSECKMFCEE